MPRSYQNFLRKQIDLGPLGIERRPEEFPYFCTPKGASIIGWAGVDGIHYCFVRGFGEMVFAVSPMNEPGQYVHPLAANFTDFLRLLLACGSADALEQAHGWEQPQFDAFLRENPPTTEQQAVLAALAARLGLAPMQAPFAYLKALQQGFDYGKLRFTEEYDDVAAPPEEEPLPAWKVYFEEGFLPRSGRGRPGRELPLGQTFDWAGEHWLIPALYLCGKGLVVDFCQEVEPERLQAFFKKWELPPYGEGRERTPEEQLQLEAENPFRADIAPRLCLNGRSLHTSHGYGLVWNPCLPEGERPDRAAESALAHYGLNPTRGWAIQRAAFPWATKRPPQLKQLVLTLTREPTALAGPRCRFTAPGDQFVFVHPASGVEHTLTVQEYEQQELPPHSFGEQGYDFPTHFVAMTYTLTPDLPGSAFSLQDCAQSDTPRLLQPASPFGPTATNDVMVGIIGGADGPVATSDATVNVIGGADGPTAIIIGSGAPQPALHAACSAVHFQPVSLVEWRFTFWKKTAEDLTIPLL